MWIVNKISILYTKLTGKWKTSFFRSWENIFFLILYLIPYYIWSYLYLRYCAFWSTFVILTESGDSFPANRSDLNLSTGFPNRKFWPVSNIVIVVSLSSSLVEPEKFGKKVWKKVKRTIIFFQSVRLTNESPFTPCILNTFGMVKLWGGGGAK